MRKIWILFLLIFSAASVNAQTTVSGKVKDNKNKPVPGVSITLKDSYDGATTDSIGNFSFKTSEKGEFTLIASAIGYKNLSKKSF